MTRSRSFRLPAAAAALAALAAVLASAAFGDAPATAAPLGATCTTGQLAATFSAIPGSAGAGNITYALRLRNVAKVPCSVSGLPQFTLLDAKGHKLPSSQDPLFRGAGAAVLVTLAPGASAWASARFSPDVAGPGEPTTGPCEPTAARVRVIAGPGGATATGPVQPPTPVCVSGHLTVGLLSTVKPTA
jgi:hypothetical protein